jgi:gas vesicle protein
MTMAKKKSNGSFISGFLVGGAIGTVLGMLLAPRTGKENRKMMKKSIEALPDLAEDLATTIKLQTGRFSQTTMKKWEGTMTRLQDAIAAGIEASQEEGKKEEKMIKEEVNINDD